MRKLLRGGYVHYLNCGDDFMEDVWMDEYRDSKTYHVLHFRYV